MIHTFKPYITCRVTYDLSPSRVWGDIKIRGVETLVMIEDFA